MVDAFMVGYGDFIIHGIIYNNLKGLQIKSVIYLLAHVPIVPKFQ